MCALLCTHVRARVCVCVCVCVCMYVCTCNVCMHACMYVCMYACMYVCIQVIVVTWFIRKYGHCQPRVWYRIVGNIGVLIWRIGDFEKTTKFKPLNPFMTTVDTAKWRRIAKLKLAKCCL